MAAKILVSLSAYKVSLARFEKGQLLDFATHDNGPAGQQAFDALLQTHPDLPIYIAVDTVDEEYRAENLPHVWGPARHNMTQRKLLQLFRSAPYRACWRQGRLPAFASKRQDDQYLFIAITKEELVRPYVDLIQSRKAPLAGIYLLPLLTYQLASQMSEKSKGALWISLQNGGLRQSFFLHGFLRFSRLTPIDLTEPRDLFYLYRAEIDKSRLFLYNNRQLSRDSPLTAYVIDYDGSLAALPAEFENEPGFQCTVFRHEDICATLKLPAHTLPRDAEALHLYLMGRFPPRVSLAIPWQTSGYTNHQIRRGLFMLSGGIAVVAGLWSGTNIYQGYANQAATRQAIADSARYHEQYRLAASRFPTAPTTAENLRKAVEIATSLRELARDPGLFMVLVSQALGNFPQIEITRLTWHYAPLGIRGTEAMPRAFGTATPASWYQRGTVEAEIRPFTGDYRSALALIENFAAKLRTHPDIAEVSITKLPVDLDPSNTLTGSTQDTLNTPAMAAQFQISISLRAGI